MQMQAMDNLPIHWTALTNWRNSMTAIPGIAITE
jgi:hypothetical protein